MKNQKGVAHRTRVYVLVIAVAMLLALVLPGCDAEKWAMWGGSAEDPVDFTPTDELVIYLPPSGSDFDLVLHEFKTRYPNVEVTTKTLGSFSSDEEMDQYDEQLSAEIMSGTGPDIIFPSEVIRMDLYKAMDNGAFLNLNAYLEKDETFRREDYVEAVLDAGRYNDRQYIMPLGFRFELMLAKSAKLDAIGFDWSKSTDLLGFMDEVLRCAPKAAESSAFESMFSCNQLLYTFQKASGLALVDHENQLALLDKEGLRAFCEAYKRHYTEKDLGSFTLYGAQSLDDLIVGNYVFQFPWSLQETVLISSYLKGSGGGYELGAIPNMSGGLTARVAQSVAIRAGSPNKLNAYNFIRLLLQPEFQSFSIAVYGLGFPVHKDSLRSIVFESRDSWDHVPGIEKLSDDEAQALVDLASGVDQSSLVREWRYNEINQMFLATMLPYFRDEKSLDECLKELDYNLTIFAGE